jgi:hypothetical protein
LPANDDTPIAVTDVDGNVTAAPASEIKTKPMVGTVEGQVALADLYEVKLGELGELLLHIGRQLGDGRPVVIGGPADAPTVSVPLATAQPGGWMKVRLTRLPFPPVCVGCGLVSRDSIAHTLDVSRSVQVEVPLCQPCQADRRTRRRRAVIFGLAAGLAPGLIGIAVGAPFLDAEELAIVGLLMFPVGIVCGLVVGLIVREVREPVRFKDYSAASGTVAMWLRPGAGAVAFRRAVGLADEPDAAAV